MSWDRVAFGSVCNLVNGRAFKESDWSATGAPIIRIQNLNGPGRPFNYWQGSLDRQVRVKHGDLLLAWSGTPGTSFGAHLWYGPDAILNQHIFRCDIDRNRLTPEWASFTLNFQLDELIQQSHGAVGLRHVTRGAVEQLGIPLPPMPEQRRIAAILHKAEELRAKRRDAIAQLDTLAQSIFLEMFGDPATNPRGWPQHRFHELLGRIESGWSPVCMDRPIIGGEWGVLKLGAVTKCEYDPRANKALPVNIQALPPLEVKPGDLLFSRKNTYELVGACALVRDTPPRLLLPDLIFRLVLRPNALVEPTFLHALLTYPTKRREIQKLASGSAGSMPNISKARLASALIEAPPLGLQREFGQRVNRIKDVSSIEERDVAHIDALFFSLQYCAFRGEL